MGTWDAQEGSNFRRAEDSMGRKLFGFVWSYDSDSYCLVVTWVTFRIRTAFLLPNTIQKYRLRWQCQKLALIASFNNIITLYSKI